MQLAKVPTSAFSSPKTIKVEKYSYNPHDLIGSGFSSQVYKGKDDTTNESVAIKVIDRKKITNKVEESLLNQEIKALQIMGSPNVIKMLDYYHKADHTYIITEFCDHGHLGSLIKRKRQIEEAEAIKILKNIVHGFQEQISKGVIHRDLKPINILIKRGVPKIADYGFSKMMNAPPESVYYNVGTALYMSPQSMIKNLYSEKTDIWSLGVIYYEMLFGQVPFTAPTEKELAQIIVSTPPPFPKNLNVSQESRDLIQRCLQVDENKRISCADLVCHPLFTRRHTMTVSRPSLINNRSSSIQSPHRATEYRPRQEESKKAEEVKPFFKRPNHLNQVFDQQIALVEYMGRIIQVLEKLQTTIPSETQKKLKFVFVRNAFMRSNLLMSIFQRRENCFQLKGFDQFSPSTEDTAKVESLFQKHRQNLEGMYKLIEGDAELKQSILRGAFQKLYEDYKCFESYHFHLLFQQLLKQLILELYNRCQNRVAEKQSLELPEETMIYLLQLLISYYAILRFFLESRNDAQGFASRFNLREQMSKNPSCIDKENLNEVRQKMIEFRI